MTASYAAVCSNHGGGGIETSALLELQQRDGIMPGFSSPDKSLNPDAVARKLS